MKSISRKLTSFTLALGFFLNSAAFATSAGIQVLWSPAWTQKAMKQAEDPRVRSTVAAQSLESYLSGTSKSGITLGDFWKSFYPALSLETQRDVSPLIHQYRNLPMPKISQVSRKTGGGGVEQTYLVDFGPKRVTIRLDSTDVNYVYIQDEKFSLDELTNPEKVGERLFKRDPQLKVIADWAETGRSPLLLSSAEFAKLSPNEQMAYYIKYRNYMVSALKVQQSANPKKTSKGKTTSQYIPRAPAGLPWLAASEPVYAQVAPEVEAARDYERQISILERLKRIQSGIASGKTKTNNFKKDFETFSRLDTTLAPKLDVNDKKTASVLDEPIGNNQKALLKSQMSAVAAFQGSGKSVQDKMVLAAKLGVPQKNLTSFVGNESEFTKLVEKAKKDLPPLEVARAVSPAGGATPATEGSFFTVKKIVNDVPSDEKILLQCANPNELPCNPAFFGFANGEGGKPHCAPTGEISGSADAQKCEEMAGGHAKIVQSLVDFQKAGKMITADAECEISPSGGVFTKYALNDPNYKDKNDVAIRETNPIDRTNNNGSVLPDGPTKSCVLGVAQLIRDLYRENNNLNIQGLDKKCENAKCEDSSDCGALKRNQIALSEGTNEASNFGVKVITGSYDATGSTGTYDTNTHKDQKHYIQSGEVKYLCSKNFAQDYVEAVGNAKDPVKKAILVGGGILAGLGALAGLSYLFRTLFKGGKKSSSVAGGGGNSGGGSGGGGNTGGGGSGGGDTGGGGGSTICTNGFYSVIASILKPECSANSLKKIPIRSGGSGAAEVYNFGRGAN